MRPSRRGPRPWRHLDQLWLPVKFSRPELALLWGPAPGVHFRCGFVPRDGLSMEPSGPTGQPVANGTAATTAQRGEICCRGSRPVAAVTPWQGIASFPHWCSERTRRLRIHHRVVYEEQDSVAHSWPKRRSDVWLKHAERSQAEAKSACKCGHSEAFDAGRGCAGLGLSRRSSRVRVPRSR